MKLVVSEEAIELGPDGISVVVIIHHRVEEVLGDGEVEPVDDGGVEDHPLLVVHHEARVHGAVNMTMEQVLAEQQGHIPLTSGVGGGGLIKDHRDMLVDVQIANESHIQTGEGIGGGRGSRGAHGGGGEHGTVARVAARLGAARLGWGGVRGGCG